MTPAKIDIDVAPIAKEAAGQWAVVVNMTGYTSWKIRLWIGALLIRFACWIVGFHFEKDRDWIDLRKAEVIKK